MLAHYIVKEKFRESTVNFHVSMLGPNYWADRTQSYACFSFFNEHLDLKEVRKSGAILYKEPRKIKEYGWIKTKNE